MSAQKNRAEIILIIEWVLFSLAVALLASSMVAFSENIIDAFNGIGSNPNHHKTVQIVVILMTVSVLFSLFLNILLTAGIKKEHSTACKTWYIISIILIIIYGLDFIWALIAFNILGLFIKGIVLGYRVYAVKTIIAFTKVLMNPTAGDVEVVYTSRTRTTEDNPPPYHDTVDISVEVK